MSRISALFVSVLLIAAVVAQASPGHTVAGTLTSAGPGMIEVREKDQVSAFTLTADTQYRKWLMAKPWQQDTRADLKSLQLGMRVRVDVEETNPHAAKTVWIVIR